MRGRGASENPPNRFDPYTYEPLPEVPPEDGPGPRTQFFLDRSRSLITRNDSPDVGFTYSINPYRGCEHGCVYCFARPTHEYLGWSSGLDFETKILVKADAPQLLYQELAAPHWCRDVLALSGVTDCYQPIERHLRLTRACLEVLVAFRQPVVVVTKNHLVCRDKDLLAELARYHAACVYLSVTTLDAELAGRLEPRTSRPGARLAAIAELAQAGIPVGVLTAPVIPGLNDHEIPALLRAAAEHGATFAGYILLRLPFALKELFDSWLRRHYPEKRDKVLSRLRELRGGKLYDAQWGTRMTGTGPMAEAIASLFRLAARRAGLDRPHPPLSADSFRIPGRMPQKELFSSE
ncbi:MAG: PA0069 family radical SAM protein [Gemmatales bacterium]|nr:PA0069 family radical SAM protein [Gemmatales bacterium]MDW8221798.1 PA0069 family radical SAM protein [Gemmatales bacterium]